jgi:hypothetical protein
MKKHDKDTMRRMYEEWESSGMSMKAFSLENHINPATFNYWARSIKNERQQTGTTGFVRLPVPMPVAGGALAASITFPSGARLDLYHPIDASFVKSLVG